MIARIATLMLTAATLEVDALGGAKFHLLRASRVPEHQIVAMNHFGAPVDTEDERNVA